jgi:uncharacterized protein (TIGR00297 family)
MEQSILSKILVMMVLVVIAFRSFSRKSIDLSGMIAMLLMGAIPILTENWVLFAAMGSMYVTGTFFTRYKRSEKDKQMQEIQPHNPRNAKQALANLGIASLCALFQSADPIWMNVMGLSAVAASNADTWSSEIGVLSKENPKLLLSRKPVKAGVSGGVTTLGTMAGLAGSLLIAVISALMLESMMVLFVVLISGCAGFLMDSLTGELFQALFTNKEGTATEIPTNHLMKGYRWISNDVINFFCTFTGAIVACLMYACIS